MAKFEIAETLPEGVEESNVKLPERSTEKSAGYDLASAVDTVVPAHGRVLVPTGVTCKLSRIEYLAVVPRSGLALKKGITVLNTPGTVDADYYPNCIGVILYNTTDEDFVVNVGDRIAQGIIHEYNITVDDKAEGKRTGGFGSTGIGG